MAPRFQVRRVINTLLLVWSLAFIAASSSLDQRQVAGAEHGEEPCPPCELLFSKLERTGRDGKLAQDIRVQQRGEPKCGTGIIYFWVIASMKHACDYLQELFGRQSCRIDRTHLEVGRFHRSMIFEPALGRNGSRCSCETIDRVSITTSKKAKHMLPVESSCAFSHHGGIGFSKMEAGGTARRSPCSFPDGSHVNNLDELWRCMHEANCDITDDWIQMSTLRDPRPAIVSTFYHVETHSNRKLGNLDAFVARELPIMCQWLALRHMLFAGILGDQSIEIWYSDAFSDPLGWHYHWFQSIGMQLPMKVIESSARAAATGKFDFSSKPMDTHPGEKPRVKGGVRRFQDEVSPETLELADAVLRTWLPPVLLERLGVVP